MKILQSIIFGVFTIIVFSDLGNGDAGVQNREGVAFFLGMMIVFGGLNGTMAVFS